MTTPVPRPCPRHLPPSSRSWEEGQQRHEEGRTFRRVAYEAPANRGIYRVHRSHVDGSDALVKYTDGGACSWSIGPDGTARTSATTRLEGPGTVPAYVGRLHDGGHDDALVDDDFGDHPREGFLRTDDRATASS